jgi:hypothetical protein
MKRISALVFGASSLSAGAANVMFIETPGFEEARHMTLKTIVSQELGDISADKQVCVAHGTDGIDAISKSNVACDAGVAVLGAAPMPEALQKINGRVLVIGAELDGSIPFSHFAAARHRSANVEDRHFAVIRGASHASFTSGMLMESDAQTDLKSVASQEETFKTTAAILRDFVKGDGEALSAAKAAAEQLATPVVKALQLEGSTQLGHAACNSDWPTNPTCQYPKYPDHSLPLGPAPAPSPPLPSDCICGSPWVKQSGALAYNIPGPYTSFINDAFQDVSDTHPFHLPHIFNKCSKPDASCVLNTTTVTMPVQKAGDLWPKDAKSAPLSVYEFKTKFKSREAIRVNAHDPTASSNLDKVSDMCKNINKAAFDWALANAESSVKSRYQQKGEPMVMVDDVEATIGITGPEWIKDELVYKRVKDSTSPTGTRIEVQSWKFVVGNTASGNLPWFFPVGMHYCKLLSPARAMEWIYTDSMRYSAQTDTVVV